MGYIDALSRAPFDSSDDMEVEVLDERLKVSTYNYN